MRHLCNYCKLAANTTQSAGTATDLARVVADGTRDLQVGSIFSGSRSVAFRTDNILTHSYHTALDR